MSTIFRQFARLLTTREARLPETHAVREDERWPRTAPEFLHVTSGVRR